MQTACKTDETDLCTISCPHGWHLICVCRLCFVHKVLQSSLVWVCLQLLCACSASWAHACPRHTKSTSRQCKRSSRVRAEQEIWVLRMQPHGSQCWHVAWGAPTLCLVCDKATGMCRPDIAPVPMHIMLGESIHAWLHENGDGCSADLQYPCFNGMHDH